MNRKITRQHKLLAAAALAIAALIAACDIGGRPVDNQVFSPFIGDQGVHLLNAGQHSLNAASLSAKDEDSLGQSVGVAITNHYPLVHNDTLNRYVNLVGLTVASASANPGGNWVFGVIDTSEINAFSGPNGYVFVTRGAIAQMHDEAELAGVLAHEIAHVCNHDGLKQVKAAEERSALSEGMQASGGQIQQFSALADQGVDAITKTGYSQPQELAADKAAIVTAAAAGYDASSYLHFLQRMQSVGASGGGQVMSTHPGIGQRIQVVTQQLRTVRPGGATLAPRFNTNTHAPS